MVHFKNPFKSKEKREKDKLEKEPLYDYEVGDTLGEGGFGTVKRAHQKGAAAGADVAIKIIPRHHIAPGRNDAKEIERRFRMMKSLRDHPHIITLLDWRITRSTIFAFYELCRGKDLFDKVIDSPNGRFTENQARIATRALTDAIAYIHERGICHRDIKPENVFMRTKDGPYDDLVLADFGLSKEMEPDEVLSGAAGSPGYWSPEMASGKGYSMLADEWALGIVIYAMLSGRSPFRSLEADDLRTECAKGEVSYPQKYWSNISETGIDFVKGLLEPDPSKRMTAKAALEHKWLTEELPEPEKEATIKAGTAQRDESQDRAGKLERRPTHGLTPAGMSLRFDKPPDSLEKPIAEADSTDEAELAKRQLSSGKTDQSAEIPGMHITTTEDVLRGAISHDKLVLLQSLDESQANTPISDRSREPSHADLASAVERFRLRDESTDRRSRRSSVRSDASGQDDDVDETIADASGKASEH